MAAPRGEGSPGRELGSCGGPWGALRGAPQALLPCPCPVLASYSLLPPPLTLLAPLVHPAIEGPLGLPAEPGRVKAAAARESTGALKAWLARHPRNPYPSKGEKVMLALVSSMSLTQVSTWFANARRRLKKENKGSWAPRGASDGDDSGSEGGPGATPGPCPSPARDGDGGSPEGGPGPGQGNETPKPKIWSVAAMLAPSESREQAEGARQGPGLRPRGGDSPGAEQGRTQGASPRQLPAEQSRRCGTRRANK